MDGIIMPVIYQQKIYRSDLKRNPNALYLFGDNDERTGFGGQAKEMRDEPNAVGIRTKHKPSVTRDSYWNDDDYSSNVSKIFEDIMPVLSHLEQGGIVVVPAAGMGSGLSKMKQHCPRTYEFLCLAIESLEEVEIKRPRPTSHK